MSCRQPLALHKASNRSCTEADALHEIARSARVRAAETLKTTVGEDAKALAMAIAGRLVARLDADTFDAALPGWLVQGIADLSQNDRTVLIGVDLYVVSASPRDRTHRTVWTGSSRRCLVPLPRRGFAPTLR